MVTNCLLSNQEGLWGFLICHNLRLFRGNHGHQKVKIPHFGTHGSLAALKRNKWEHLLYFLFRRRTMRGRNPWGSRKGNKREEAIRYEAFSFVMVPQEIPYSFPFRCPGFPMNIGGTLIRIVISHVMCSGAEESSHWFPNKNMDVNISPYQCLKRQNAQRCPKLMRKYPIVSFLLSYGDSTWY